MRSTIKTIRATIQTLISPYATTEDCPSTSLLPARSKISSEMRRKNQRTRASLKVIVVGSKRAEVDNTTDRIKTRVALTSRTRAATHEASNSGKRVKATAVPIIKQGSITPNPVGGPGLKVIRFSSVGVVV